MVCRIIAMHCRSSQYICKWTPNLFLWFLKWWGSQFICAGTCAGSLQSSFHNYQCNKFWELLQQLTPQYLGIYWNDPFQFLPFLSSKKGQDDTIFDSSLWGQRPVGVKKHAKLSWFRFQIQKASKRLRWQGRQWLFPSHTPLRLWPAPL